jgi:N-acetylglutamate synthase-like GNAT family acetyltransferase
VSSDSAHGEPVIEVARRDDDDAILALHREAGWSTRSVYGKVAVVREDGEVIGAIHLVAFAPRHVLVGAIVVREDRRGQGLGARLMRAAMAGAPGIWWLECRRERAAFYRRLGFAVVAEAAVPPAIRTTIGTQRSRPQVFMRREVS